MSLTLVLTILFAALLQLFLVPFAHRLAVRFGAIDRPGERKIHTCLIPRMGGLAIYVGILACLLFLTAMNLEYLHHSVWKLALLGASAALLIGLTDDLVRIGSKMKLTAQLLLGVGAYAHGFRIETISLGPGFMFDLGPLSLPLTALWIAAVMNAINLVDGMDGLAAGLSTIAFGMIAVLAQICGNPPVVAIALVCGAATLGFLYFNFSPAKIFMGDSGSMALGFLLAVLSVSISPFGTGGLPFYVPLLLLAFPILDTCVAITRRIVRAIDLHAPTAGPSLRLVTPALRTVLSADGDHIHHRLLNRGLSQRRVALLLYGFALVGSLVSFVMLLLPALFGWLVGLASVVGMLHMVLWLDYTEFMPRRERRRLVEQDLRAAVEQRPAVARRVAR